MLLDFDDDYRLAADHATSKQKRAVYFIGLMIDTVPPFDWEKATMQDLQHYLTTYLAEAQDAERADFYEKLYW